MLVACSCSFRDSSGFFLPPFPLFPTEISTKPFFPYREVHSFHHLTGVWQPSNDASFPMRFPRIFSWIPPFVFAVSGIQALSLLIRSLVVQLLCRFFLRKPKFSAALWSSSRRPSLPFQTPRFEVLCVFLCPWLLFFLRLPFRIFKPMPTHSVYPSFSEPQRKSETSDFVFVTSGFLD